MKMISLKQITLFTMMFIVIGIVISPVSALTYQTISATQSGTGNTQICINYNGDGASGSQSIIAIQGDGSNTGSGNYQYLLNYASGPTKPVQKIYNYQAGSGNFVFKKNIWVR